jgi:hypothetical protein
MEQQERALAAYVDDVRADADTLGVVLVGSVARGEERPDSDVDVYLVVGEERFAAETAAGRYAWTDRAGLDYPGSYVDVKLVTPVYLRAAAERGDDPTRASFLGARVAFSRDDELAALIAAIPVLPVGVRAERVHSHLAQVHLHGDYFLRQGVERGDAFLVRHAGTHLAFAAARAALAHEGVLLPGPKYVSKLLARLDAPAAFLPAWERVVADPGIQSADALIAVMTEWLGELEPDEALSTFIRDNELGWLFGRPPAEYF